MPEEINQRVAGGRNNILSELEITTPDSGVSTEQPQLYQPVDSSSTESV